MQKMYTKTPLANVETELIPAVISGNIVTVVTTIISTVTSAKVELFLYNGSTKEHTIVLNPPDNESVFIDSKIFLPEGYSMKIKSDQADTTVSAMVDDSVNS